MLVICTVMNGRNMKIFLRDQFKHFELSDVWPGRRFREAILVFLSWAFPAFLFVIWSTTYYPDVKFYQEAISEGIGPNLWNVVGSFGLFVFGIAVVFSKHFLPSAIAKHILSNTFAIGSLLFGLLFGQWYVILKHIDFGWWKNGLFGVTSGLLLLVVLIYNLTIWYLYFLISNDGKEKSEFLVKLEQMHWLWRAGIGLGLCTLITFAFLIEK